MEFTIKRSKWHRGSSVHSALLNFRGNMCCLGFLAKACGATDEQIDDKLAPSDTQEINWPEGFLVPVGDAQLTNSDLISNIICINDSTYTVNTEALLTEKFSELGIKVTFED